MNKNTLRSLAVFISALGTAAYSCSPSAEQPPGGLGLGNGASGGKGGASGASGTAGSAATATGGATAVGGASSGSSSGGNTTTGSGGSLVMVETDAETDGNTMLEDGQACAGQHLSATLKTVNMLVMFDRSWSMTECADGTGFSMGGDPRCTTGPSRWALTSEALKTFFADPSAADLRVALRFFPHDVPAQGCDGYPTTGGGMMGGMMGGFAGMTGAAGTTGTAGAAARLNCDTDACAMPMVDIAPLTADPAPTDAQEQKLIDAVNASPPPDVATLPDNPQTPTSAALAGAAKWATTYETAHPDEVTVIILITDGEPAGCDINQTNIANLAGNAFMTSNVATYVIGLGGLNAPVLDAIAAAGGTMQAYTVSSSANSNTELLATLNSIKGMAIKCDIAVPKDDGKGKKVDPTKVNVTFQSGPDGMATTFGNVASAAECGTDQGWYYDNPTAPTTITLCPSACTTATTDTMAQINVELGCQTVIVTK